MHFNFWSCWGGISTKKSFPQVPTAIETGQGVHLHSPFTMWLFLKNTTPLQNVYSNPHPFPSGRKILAFCQRWVWRKIWLQISWTLSWRNKITVCQRDQGNISWMMRRSEQVVLSEMMLMGIRLGWWNKIRVSGQRDGEIGHPAGRPFVVKWPKQSKCPQILNFSYN